MTFNEREAIKLEIFNQVLVKASFLDSKFTQVAGNAPPCKRRYTINATYAAVPMKTIKPNNSPLTSEMKKSSNTYPLISINDAARDHASLCDIKTKSLRI